MSGKDLFNQLVDATGLTDAGIGDELLKLLQSKNISIDDFNLSNLREIMEEYLSNSQSEINQ